jgi:putative ABC transport system permease protein
VTEPDAISDGFGFAPRLMVSLDGLRASGLIQPGSLVEHTPTRSNCRPEQRKAPSRRSATGQGRFPEAGWSIRTRTNAAPALSSNIERFSQFLTLVGLTALVVGGVGVANAVRAYLDGKRGVIATFKSLGASAASSLRLSRPDPDHRRRSASSSAWCDWRADALRRRRRFVLHPVPAEADLSRRAGAGGAVRRDGDARLRAAAARPRPRRAGDRAFPRTRLRGARLAARCPMCSPPGDRRALPALDLDSPPTAHRDDLRRRGVLWPSSCCAAWRWLVQAGAPRSPRVRSTALRLAIGNIHRPGALTPSVVLSLGLGLTLLVTLALIDGNLRRQIAGSLPEQAPNFFFVDIQAGEVERSRASSPRGAERRSDAVPMLRGRVMAERRRRAETDRAAGRRLGAARRPRHHLFRDHPRKRHAVGRGNGGRRTIRASRWSRFRRKRRPARPEDRRHVTVNVLGRNITARIANLRQVEWESMGINFVMVFSPNTFAGAPHAGWRR